jgi:hypothetical protein
MNARHTLIQDLRSAFDEVAERATELLVPRAVEPQLAPVPVTDRRSSSRPILLAKVFAFAMVAAIAAAATFTGTAQAHERDEALVRSDLWADGNLVDVQIQVDGEAAPLYLSPRGDTRHYFEAFAGRNYSVVLRNNSFRRIGVLLTVDGLNVVNGEITRQSPGEPMYVLGPWESATIRGWRTSMDDVRRFVFVDERRSYAQRTGQANSDMGWIRVLAFREQPRQVKFWGRNEERDQKRPLPWFDSPADRAKSAPEGASQAAPEAPSADALRGGAKAEPAPTAQRMVEGSLEKEMASRESKDEGSFPGTGWGERKTDHVQYVDFTPERGATDLIVFRYEYARGLVALGIYPDHDRLRERDGRGLVGFARPPRW